MIIRIGELTIRPNEHVPVIVHLDPEDLARIAELAQTCERGQLRFPPAEREGELEDVKAFGRDLARARRGRRRGRA